MARKHILGLGAALLLAGCVPPPAGTEELYGDQPTLERHLQSTISAAEAGASVSWSSAKGNRGVVTPIGGSYSDRSGRACRQLKQELNLGGSLSMRDVIACKEADGAWVVVDRVVSRVD